MEPHKYDPFDPKWILGTIRNFKLACGTNGVQEVAAICLSNFYMNMFLSAVLNTRRSADLTNKKLLPKTTAKSDCIPIYPQEVNFLLKKHATDGMIAGTESTITLICATGGDESIAVCRGVGRKETPL